MKIIKPLMLSQKILLIFIPLFLLCACNTHHAANTQNTITVTQQVTTTTLSFSGTIQPIQMNTINSPIDGTISQQFFDYGENVQQGQLLFKLNSPQLAQDYQNALTDYIKAKKDYLNNQAQMQGNDLLKKLGIISADEYVNDKSTNIDLALSYSQATQKLHSLLQIVANSQINLNQIPLNNTDALQHTFNQPFNSLNIYANRNGIALLPPKNDNSNSATDDSALSLGSAVKGGESLLAIGDMSGIIIPIKVNEININNIQLGQKAIITGDAFPDITLNGQVAHVDQQAIDSDSESTPSFLVKIVVPSLTDAQRKVIHVGMSANITLQISQPSSIQIPIAAVFNQNGQSMVNVVDPKTQKIIMTPVVTGPTSIDSVTILQGLHTGEMIVNNP